MKDSTAPFVAGDVGKTVWNVTDGGWTTIASFTSTSHVVLTADINLDSTDTYEVCDCRFTAKVAGKYKVDIEVQINGVDETRIDVQIFKNSVCVARPYLFAAKTDLVTAHASDIVDLAIGEYIIWKIYQAAGADKAIVANSMYTWATVTKVA